MRWPVGVLFALVAVWLILFTPWKETIPPLEEPVDTMYVYGDVRLSDLAARPDTVVRYIGASGKAFRLEGYLVITETGRLTISEEVLNVGDPVYDGKYWIQVNGSLVVNGSVILDTDPEDGTWGGIRIQPYGNLSVNASSLSGADPLVLIHDPRADLEERIKFNNTRLEAKGTALKIDDLTGGMDGVVKQNRTLALGAPHALNNMEITVGDGPALDMQGVSVSGYGLRIIGSAEHSQPLVVAQSSVLQFTQLSLEDHSSKGIALDETTLTLSSFRAENLSGEVISGVASDLSGEQWTILSSANLSSTAISLTQSNLDVDGLVAIDQGTLLDLSESELVSLANLTLSEVGSFGRIDSTQTPLDGLYSVTISNLDHTGNRSFAEGLSISGEFDVYISEAMVNVTGLSDYLLADVATLRLENSSIESAGTAFATSGSTKALVDFSTLTSHPVEAVISASDDSRIILFGSIVSGGNPQAQLSAQISKAIRPGFSVSHRDATNDTVAALSIYDGRGGLQKVLAIPVAPEPEQDVQLPRFAGVYEPDWNRSGTLLELWTLAGDGTENWVDAPEAFATMYRLEWDVIDSSGQLWVPIQDSRTIHLDLAGDADLDGWLDTQEDQLGAKAVMAAEAPMIHDLSAVDHSSLRIDQSSKLTVQPPLTSGPHRVWLRWSGSDVGSEGVNCADISLPDTPAAPHLCVPLPSAPEWIPGPLATLDSDSPWVTVVVTPDTGEKIVLDEIWLIPEAQLPTAGWLADLDRDGLLDGLEQPGFGGFHPIMPTNSVWGDSSNPAQPSSSSPWGWQIMQNATDELVAPTGVEDATIWIHGTPSTNDSWEVSLSGGTPIPLFLEARPGWQQLRMANGTPIEIGWGTGVNLISKRGGNVLDAIWYRSDWQSSTESNLTSGVSSLSFPLERVEPGARLSLKGTPAEQISMVNPNPVLLAYDESTRLTTMVDEACRASSFYRAGDLTDKGPDTTLPCSLGQTPLALAVEEGWIALLVSDDAGEIELMITPYDTTLVWEPFRTTLTTLDADNSSKVSLTWEGGRLLVEAGATNWWIGERNSSAAGNWSFHQLGSGDGATDPVSAQMELLGSGLTLMELDVCITGDRLFYLLGLGFGWFLGTGLMSEGETFGPEISTSMIQSSGQVRDEDRSQILWSWEPRLQNLQFLIPHKPEFTCTPNEVIVLEDVDAGGWDRIKIMDTRTGQVIHEPLAGWTHIFPGVASTVLVYHSSGEWRQWSIRDSEGNLGVTGEWHGLGSAPRGDVPAIVTPWQTFVPLEDEDSGSISPPTSPYPVVSGYSAWWAEVTLSQPALAPAQEEVIRTIRAPWLDHEVALDSLVPAILRHDSGLNLELSSNVNLTVRLTNSGVASNPLLRDSDSDGLSDGIELNEMNGGTQLGLFSDATTGLHCVQPRQVSALEERWGEYPELRLDDQCHLGEGTQLFWRPGEGAGASLQWPLSVERTGIHRLTLDGTPFVTPISSVQTSQQGEGPLPPVQLSVPAQALPSWMDSAREQWLPNLLIVEVVDENGDSLPVSDDSIWIDEPRVETTARGAWTLRVRLGGWLDVQVENVSTMELRIRWQPDAWRPDLVEMTGLDEGPTDVNDFEYLHIAPLHSFAWGPLGGLDPLDSDTDDDGLADGAEAMPAAVDADEDGLTDPQEVALGTLSTRRDTDGDGLFDGIEVGLRSAVNDTTCQSEAVAWRHASAINRTSLGGISACSEGEKLGAASWLHRRLDGRLLNLTSIARADGDSSSWTEPLNRDTDGDGLPDGWVDGWEYIGQTADLGISEPDSASGAASVLELATLGAYDETRWRPGMKRDGLLSVLEGEDWNLDGDSGGQLYQTGMPWALVPDWHFSYYGMKEFDPSVADTDGDLMPDGWELLASVWFTDHGFASTLQNPVEADANSDNDTTNGQFIGLNDSMNYDTTMLELEHSDDTIWAMNITPASEYPINCSSTARHPFEAFQFHIVGLPEGTQVALTEKRILNGGSEGLWDVLEKEPLSAPDWNEHSGGQIEFSSPHEASPGVWEVRLSSPEKACRLGEMLLLLKFPDPREGHTEEMGLLTLETGSEAKGFSSRTPDLGGSWNSTMVNWSLVVSLQLVGEVVGDGLSALSEYWMGTMPTRLDSDAALGAGRRDLLSDRIEVAPDVALVNGLVPVAEIPLRWVTTGHRARLGWRWFTGTASSSVIGLDPDLSSSGSSTGTRWWFEADRNGAVTGDELVGTSCSDPRNMTMFARLDDGTWLATNRPITGSPGSVTELCVFHRSVHQDDDSSWTNKEATGYHFSLVTSPTLPAQFSGPWTIDVLPRHQYGFVGAPFQRDADGDGLIDGLEGKAAWGGSSTTLGDLSRWRSISGLGTDMLPLSAWQTDHDFDGIPDMWDSDADGDGMLDGLEPGWAIDLDGDGLPGAIDPDSDSDGVPDGAEHLPFTDSDSDGFLLNVSAPSGLLVQVRIGVNALDIDSDDDGLPDGFVDGVHWAVNSTASNSTRVGAWLDRIGPDNGTAGTVLSDATLAKWFPAPITIGTSPPIRLAGGPVFATSEPGAGGQDISVGRFSVLTQFDESPDVRQPWEGEDRDGTPGFATDGGDSDPSRMDTDMDGLLDGVALFVGWDGDLDRAAADGWTWSGEASTQPTGLARATIQTRIRPDVTDAPQLGAWARAGELVGPNAPRAWLPPSPWQHVSMTYQGGFEVDCRPATHSARTGAGLDRSRAGWQESLFSDANGSTVSETLLTACWDLFDNSSAAKWDWVGWANATMSDTDGDGLEDGEERALFRIQPAIPAWYEWWADVTQDVHASRAFYHTASDPRFADTDGDSLPDGLERLAGYATDDPDSDHDGIPDDIEDADGDGKRGAYETDPLALDSDRDGLPDGGRTSDLDSVIAFDDAHRAPLDRRDTTFHPTFFDYNPGELSPDGSLRLGSPIRADSDSDGLNDGTEWLVWKTCSSPCAVEANDLIWHKDADNDTLWDSAEIPFWARPVYGEMPHSLLTGQNAWWLPYSLDPSRPDTDGDGLSDGLEPYPHTDTDGDGIINGRQRHSSGASSTDSEISALLAWRIDAVTWAVASLAVEDGGPEFSSGYGDGSGTFVRANALEVHALPRDTIAVLLPSANINDAGESKEFGGSTLETSLPWGDLRAIEAEIGADGAVDALYLQRDERTWIKLTLTSEVLDVTPPAINWEFNNSNSLVDTRMVLWDDVDFDGASNAVEEEWGSNDTDRDSDDDGLRDGIEISLCQALRNRIGFHWSLMVNALSYDIDGDGLLCVLDVDSDGDGIRDGVEAGVTSPVGNITGLPIGLIPGTDVTATLPGSSVLRYLPDADPTTRTDPLNPDTDGDGVPDGWLDRDSDLVMDADEVDRTFQRLEIPAVEGEGHRIWTDSSVDWLDVTTGAGRETLRGGEDWDGSGGVDEYELNPLDPDQDDDGLPDGPSTRFRSLVSMFWGWGAEAGTPLANILADSALSSQLHERCTGESWTATNWAGDGGLAEGTPLANLDRDNDGRLNHFDPDSDNDGLPDGLECGVNDAIVRALGWWEQTNGSRVIFSSVGGQSIYGHGVNVSVAAYRADRDSGSVSDPWDADSDDDGLTDGREDFNRDGVVNETEPNPMLPDSDGDGLMDGTEMGIIANETVSWATDSTRHVPEWGAGTGMIYTFVADADEGWFTTDPRSSDSDGDGLLDGEEDINRNGAYDEWDLSNLQTGITACEWAVNEQERSSLPIEHWEYQPGCELDADNPDTDLDGVLDGAELEGWLVEIYTERFTGTGSAESIALGDLWASFWTNSSPWLNDTEGDGVLDGTEQRWRADPRSNDSDSDNMDDLWELQHNGSLVSRDGRPPTVEANQAEMEFEMFIRRSGTTIYLVRSFTAQLRITDPAGVASANIWMSPHGVNSNSANAPTDAVDLHSLVISGAGVGGYVDSYSASTLSAGSYGSATESVRVERGLVTGVVWVGSLEEEVSVSADAVADAMGAVVDEIINWAAGALGFEVEDASHSDLLDQFGGWNLHVRASDSNGNVGVGTVEFDSLTSTIMEGLTAVWQSLVELFDRFREIAAGVLEAAIAWVKEKAMWLVDNVVKPLIDMYLSAAALLYPWIEYFVVILEVFAYGDVMSFWEHEFTQAAFGAVLDLLREWNMLTYTESPSGIIGWIQNALSSAADFLMENVPSSLGDIVDIFLNMIPLKNSFLEDIGGAISDGASNQIMLILLVLVVIYRASMATPKALPLPSTILAALIFAAMFSLVFLAISALLDPVVDRYLTQGVETETAGRGGLPTMGELAGISLLTGNPMLIGYLFDKLSEPGQEMNLLILISVLLFAQLTFMREMIPEYHSGHGPEYNWLFKSHIIINALVSGNWLHVLLKDAPTGDVPVMTAISFVLILLSIAALFSGSPLACYIFGVMALIISTKEMAGMKDHGLDDWKEDAIVIEWGLSLFAVGLVSYEIIKH